METTTRAIIIPVLGSTTTKMLNKRWADLRPQLAEILGESPEHVAVLYEGQRRDMFVGETSSINGRHIRNMRATEIYRANTVSQMPPGYDPEELPAISGPAVIFPDTIVWT